jgi:hypothetical protein
MDMIVNLFSHPWIFVALAVALMLIAVFLKNKLSDGLIVISGTFIGVLLAFAQTDFQKERDDQQAVANIVSNAMTEIVFQYSGYRSIMGKVNTILSSGKPVSATNPDFADLKSIFDSGEFPFYSSPKRVDDIFKSDKATKYVDVEVANRLLGLGAFLDINLRKARNQNVEYASRVIAIRDYFDLLPDIYEALCLQRLVLTKEADENVLVRFHPEALKKLQSYDFKKDVELHKCNIRAPEPSCPKEGGFCW